MEQVKPKQLAQARPANTTAVSALAMPDGNSYVEIDTIIVCNTTSSDATFRLFHDDDGTTYDQSTAFAYDANCPANQSVHLEFLNPLIMRGGNLAVRTSTGNALTFTVYGKEVNA